MTKLELLKQSATEHKIAVVVYKRKRDNKVNKYYVEPYSYRPPYVWVWDIKDKRIKSFLYNSIIKVKISSQEFEPDPLYKIEF